MANMRKVHEDANLDNELSRKNPLRSLSLGDLVFEMHKLYASDPNVILSKKDIPESSLDNYKRYHSIIKELNDRESKYNSYKSPPIFGRY